MKTTHKLTITMPLTRELGGKEKLAIEHEFVLFTNIPPSAYRSKLLRNFNGKRISSFGYEYDDFDINTPKIVVSANYDSLPLEQENYKVLISLLESIINATDETLDSRKSVALQDEATILIETTSTILISFK